MAFDSDIYVIRLGPYLNDGRFSVLPLIPTPRAIRERSELESSTPGPQFKFASGGMTRNNETKIL